MHKTTQLKHPRLIVDLVGLVVDAPKNEYLILGIQTRRKECPIGGCLPDGLDLLPHERLQVELVNLRRIFINVVRLTSKHVHAILEYHCRMTLTTTRTLSLGLL